MALIRNLVLMTAAFLTVAGTAGSLGAQTAAKQACDADASKGNLAKAAFTVEQARAAQGTPSSATLLASAVKQLESAKGESSTVQALVLGETLALWLGQPHTSLMPKRGSVGFVQNPDASIDLVVTIDSLFRVVETAKPACAEITSYYRGALPGYFAIVNGAINALNLDKLDSAEFLATQANRLYPASPYGTMVLGTVASKRKNETKAQEYWTTAATVAARDTIYRDVQRQVLSNQGVSYLSAANVSSDAERQTIARQAVDVYTRLLAIPDTSKNQASNSRQSLRTAYLLAGDTAAFVAMYEPLLANPSSYGHQELLNSAVAAARANRSADAAKLFEGTLSQNPFSRDALYNLAVTYLSLGQNDKVSAIVERLVAVDPANPENYNLAARAYLAQAKVAQAAKKTSIAATYNDSTMRWYGRGNKLPVEVIFTEFSPNERQITVGGKVTDRRDKIDAVNDPSRALGKGAKSKAAAKSLAAALTPAPVILMIEALDKAGAVLGRQTLTTEALMPGKSASFTSTIQAPNAVAYRYSLGS